MENQNSGTGQQSINIQIPTAENIANRRSLIPAAFALVIILFMFSFFEFQYYGRKVASFTGINLVTGKSLKDRDLMTGREREVGKLPPNFWALLSLGVAIVGLGVVLIKGRRETMIGMGAGIAGFISLIILQFDIKGKTNKEFRGQVEADFQFPYWLALIALGVAAYICYLRTKKSYQIVGSTSPPSEEIITPTENVTQIQPSVSTIPQTSNFDIGEWLNKNKKYVLGIIGLTVVLFGVYYFFIKQDPIKDAKKAATAFCECEKEHVKLTTEKYKKFISEIDSIKFSGRADAQKGLEALNQNNNATYQQCYNAAQEKLTKFKGRYIGDKEKTEKFEYAYNAQSGLCNENSSELGSLYNLATEKVNQYDGPVEIEQRRLESIAAIEAENAAALVAAQEALSFGKSVEIGSQVWMTRNLNVSTYRNGDPIPQVTDPAAWAALTTGAWCYYNNDPANEAIYGKLYNWYAVNDPRGLAPSGWHVPSDAEWTTLSNFLGGDAIAGGAMKETGTTHWLTPNTGATNSSGFTGFPGGLRNNDGSFSTVGHNGFWWSSTENSTSLAWLRVLLYSTGNLIWDFPKKLSGSSVRCVRD